MSIRLGLISLGCAKNLVDSEHMLAQLAEAGVTIVDDVAEADVAVINTCGFIESAKQEAIQTILETAELKKSGQLKALIVTGCLVQRYPEEITEEMPEIDAVLGTGSYTNIVDAVRAVMQAPGTVYRNFGQIDEAEMEGGRILLTPGYSAYLKIAEGCNNHCAYCVIPKLRGKFRSRPMEDILEEARAMAAAGVREIIVVAQDITRYGTDLYGERRLSDLLHELCAMDFTWVRLHYLYPDEITDDMIETIATEPKIVKYLDIPIQHVNNRILKAMHRRGDSAFLRDLFGELRSRIPGLVLRTSLIVGLPGETEEEFEELCEFMREMNIERAGVFCYSPEEGSEAAEMPDQIDEETKNERRMILEELQSDVLDRFAARMKGQLIEVLCEGWDGETGLYYGRSYADSPDIDGRVLFDSAFSVEEGQFVPVRITGAQGADLTGNTETME
ncbi:30S ribosomal protein S12 methylthiotransferase RimO [Butyricicoccus porcorum]|uniref:30S ribosomal protein S12 methylthiotransferase RimO n=1 Tax=Butyricicoccus porcorum TaxID=1945634 RepID=UPI00196B71F2|nr:30S ribosomal protein S12 methylthiotransferase RimO [Butyricicoccus porcorum]MDY4483044.1 30S ribosomal protein S12 methylthiotransferase RimO [Butyricicoccus porcorum]